MSLPCNGYGRRSGSVSDVHVISAHEGGSWEVSIDERGRDHAQHDRDLRRIDHGRTPERGLAEHQQRGDDDGGRADADQDLHAVLRRQGDGEGGDRRRQGVGWTGDRRAMARGVDPAGAIGRDQHHLVQIGEPDGDHPPYRLRRGVDERRAQPERPCHLAPVHGGGADGREGKRGGPWACRMAEPARIVASAASTARVCSAGRSLAADRPISSSTPAAMRARMARAAAAGSLRPAAGGPSEDPRALEG